MERNPIFLTTNSEDLKEALAGRRHVLCPHYDTCLNEAVKKDKLFDCGQCSFKKHDISVYLAHDGLAA